MLGPRTQRLLGGAALVAAASRPRAAAAQATASHAAPEVPPAQLDFVQWGAAITVESRANAGDVCPADAKRPCILGSGGGVALRVGRRWHQDVYMGGAYEFSKQDASNLLRLPILQQARIEARDYLSRGTRLVPYVGAAVGVAAYGSEWRVDTLGPMGGVTGGLEFESTREVFVGLGLAYKVMRLSGWVDGAQQERPAAFAHFVALELTLETRSAFARW